MKRIFGLLGAGLLASTLAVTVYAADQPTPTASPPAASPGAMMGEHDMVGTIHSINHKTGVIKLSSKPHDMELHFPPESIKDLNKGDKITVHLGFQKS